LGKYTFSDVAAYRFQQKPIRVFAASGTLVVVIFYLIAQMVGAGQLIKLLFGISRIDSYEMNLELSDKDIDKLADYGISNEDFKR